MAAADSQEAELPKLAHDQACDAVVINTSTDDNNIQDSTEEDVLDEDTINSANDADSVIGFSIGHGQDVMKSPTTPAVDKAQALDRSRSYFFAETGVRQTRFSTATNEQKTTQGRRSSLQSKVDGSGSDAINADSSISSLSQTQKKKQHSSFVGSLLANATQPRKRSSSGSSMIDALKKLLPDHPSSQQSQSSTYSVPGHDQTDSRDSSKYRLTTTESPEQYDEKSVVSATERTETVVQKRVQVVDGNENPASPVSGRRTEAHLLRRATSDHSLYLKRTVTGASQFDDYDAFSNVSEMVNSRFKAITDSLQDSSLKLPKLSLPSLRPHSSRASSNGAHDESTNVEEGQDSVPAPDARSRNVAAGDSFEKQHSILTDALSKAEGDLVIMGGYRGSILREAQAPNRQIWVPVKVGLNLRKADLEVGLTYEDELRMEEKIIPSGTLSHIGPIDISRRLIKKCTKCRNSRGGKLKVHDWGYDWRLSPSLLTERLIKYLENLNCNKPTLPVGKRGAWVIAHSLGGLVTRNAINKRPELFAGVVFAGTPQHCVNILGPLRNGDDVLLSSRVLTAQVNFTLRTSYALLPESGRCFINKDTGERYDVDFFNFDTWDEHRLSPCVAPPLHHTTKPRKQSIIGSITDSISTLPSKRLSIFSTSNNDSTQSISSVHSTSSQQGSSSPTRATHFKDHAEDVAHKTKHAANAASGNPSGVNHSLEPIMTHTQTFQKPSVATQVTIPRQDAQVYLKRTLAQVKQFKIELAHDPDLQHANKYPPHAILYSKAIPTVYGAKVASREAIKYDDAFDDLAFAAGDGVVLASAAQLPLGYRCVKGGRVESERGHVGLLGDLEGIGKCLLAIVDARAKGVGHGNFVEPKQ